MFSKIIDLQAIEILILNWERYIFCDIKKEIIGSLNKIGRETATLFNSATIYENIYYKKRCLLSYL